MNKYICIYKYTVYVHIYLLRPDLFQEKHLHCFISADYSIVLFSPIFQYEYSFGMTENKLI